ncbi:MAG: hypothetical protein AUH42_05605 [Gemmatimonadetes bacterium 13_1_40CM_70_11]|nr:MAG: hypothetical protein AUH42_05605 [Gemmatimonadetes bacterium 13_1_40CM_70_11]
MTTPRASVGRRAVLASGVLLAFAAAAAAQRTFTADPGPSYASRGALEERLQRLEQAVRAGSHRFQAEANLIRARLDSGDFQPGDRILLKVEGEQQLSDTFTVGPGPALTLPQIGTIPLTRVLRAELEDHLRTHLAAFIKNPVVRARSLIRVGVVGEVARPGFYLVPPSGQVEDVLMAAGGPTQNAKLTGLVIQRAGGNVQQGQTLQRAMTEGRTLDDLGVRSGDRLSVPRHGDFGRTVTTLGAIVAIPVTIFAITRIF